MISEYIDPFIFFIALFVGFFIAYITTPVPDIVIRYPSPENSGKITYKDSANNCYKYKAKEVKCPKKINHMPIQHVDIKNKENEGVFANFQKKIYN